MNGPHVCSRCVHETTICIASSSLHKWSCTSKYPCPLIHTLTRALSDARTSHGNFLHPVAGCRVQAHSRDKLLSRQIQLDPLAPLPVVAAVVVVFFLPLLPLLLSVPFGRPRVSCASVNWHRQAALSEPRAQSSPVLLFFPPCARPRPRPHCLCVCLSLYHPRTRASPAGNHTPQGQDSARCLLPQAALPCHEAPEHLRSPASSGCPDSRR